jgi:hypothetical protein
MVYRVGKNADVVIDAHHLDHIFEAKHNLDNILQMAGSRGAAYALIQQLAQETVIREGRTGVFSVVGKIGDELVTVTGNVIEGVARVSNAWIP